MNFAYWPDGTYCDIDDLESYLAMMSDDYTLCEDLPEWIIGDIRHD